MKITFRNGHQYFVPDFFVLGTAKAGTTNMHTYLSQHPSIKMPEMKESWFFSCYNEGSDDPYKGPNYPGGVTSIKEYSNLFSGATLDSVLGDCSPSYLYSHIETITNIKKIYGTNQTWKKLKFFISLRNPIERAWSQYWTMRRHIYEDLPFKEAILEETISKRLHQGKDPFFDYIGFGNYSSQIKAYKNAFGEENIKIYLFEDWKKDQVAVCKDMFSFIGVDPSFTPTKKGTIQNISGKPQIPALNKFVLQKNPIKAILRNTIGVFMSREMRLKTKYFLLKSTVKPMTMPDEIHSILIKRYTDEINYLQEYLKINLQHWLTNKEQDKK